MMSKRIHAFDAFRGTLAIFGVILHAYYFYMIFKIHTGSFDSAVLGPQHQGNDWFSIVILWIHSFRMPAFFAISGFFSIYFFKKAGLYSTLMNRCKRILIPFLVLWLLPLIFILIKMLINHANATEIRQFLNIDQISYLGTFWFLYFLIIMDAVLLLIFIPTFQKIRRNRGFSPKMFLIMALMIGSICCMLIAQHWFTPTSTSLLPAPTALIYYSLFFMGGAVIASDPSALTKISTKPWVLGLLVSAILMGVYWILFLNFHQNSLAKIGGEILWGLMPWGMIATLYFFFESFASKPSKIWRYLGDSSYWIYIAQMPILMLTSLIFFSGNLNIFIAVPSVVAITLGTLLLSYQLLIRKRRYLNYIDGARS